MSPAGYRENKFHQVGGDVRGKKGGGKYWALPFFGRREGSFGVGKEDDAPKPGGGKERADNNFLFNVADSIIPIFWHGKKLSMQNSIYFIFVGVV